MRSRHLSTKHAAAALAGVLAALGTVQATKAQEPTTAGTWFAPYVDATLPPMYQVQNPAEDPAHQTVFGFIVASRQSPCTPSWGDYYSLAEAAGPPLSIAEVIAAMQAEGEQPIISFGGEANTPLEDACTNVSALEAAYSQVVSTYNDYVVDFDIEGAAQSDTAGLDRQAQALRELQGSLAAQGKELSVWLTLPVATTGLLPVAANVVSTMLGAGVKLAGVNLMTMYFWPAPGDGAPMLTAVTSALQASEPQLAQIFETHGINLDTAGVWAHMGATVQIGQEGVPDEAFTVADAQGLVNFAGQVGLGRVSMWSINQDTPCGSASDPTIGGYSNYCSGVQQEPLAFDSTFSALGALASSTHLIGGAGTPWPVPGSSTTSSPTLPATTTTAPTVAPTTTTDPGTSSTVTTASGVTTSGASTSSTTLPAAPNGPYAPWSADFAYPAGSRVSYQGLVYQAKWWSQGQAPTTNVAHPWDTPWEVVGTAPASDEPQSGPSEWSPTIGYPTGSLVSYSGAVYQAKWWNMGSPPTANPADPWAAPWRLVSGPALQPSAPAGPPSTTTTSATTTTLPAPPTTLPVPPTTQSADYSPWSPNVAYPAGSRVSYLGLVYQAKWWSQGQAPTTAVAHPWDTPWELVGTSEPTGTSN